MADPILIAIDKHRRAREQHLAALGEAERICDNRIGPACEAEISSWDELLATKPTTLAGLQAFLAVSRKASTLLFYLSYKGRREEPS
jgi:hypothetical protein